MSDMNFGHLLPFYLDEADEQVIALNDALLKLEQDQADATALAVAFRIVHTIKGSSAALGFVQVNKLTHHLESFFEILRSGQFQLDRPSLDLFFRCLDELKSYHQKLRETGESEVDFSELVEQVEKNLRRVKTGKTSEEPSPKGAEKKKSDIKPGPDLPPEKESQSYPPSPLEMTIGEVERVIDLVVYFENDISLPDMKARLIAKRLSTHGEILSSDPQLDKLDDVTDLTSIYFRISTESSTEDLIKSADMSGVRKFEVKEISKDNKAVEVTGHLVSNESTSLPNTELNKLVTKEQAMFEPIQGKIENPPNQPQQPASVADQANSTQGQLDNSAIETSQPVIKEQSTSSTPTPAKTPQSTQQTQEKPATPKLGKVGETVRVELERLDHLMNLTGELVLSKSRFVQVSSALKDRLATSSRRLQSSECLDRLEFLKSGLLSLTASGHSQEPIAHRLTEELRRLSEDIESMTSELNRARQARASLEDLAEAVHQLSRVCDGLQKGVLDTRMIPIGPLFERFRRVIRDLSHATGKEIKLKISGESTELDKRVIDELADPLVHMVRNAGDHGLESPDDRERVGKPRAGTISLAAAHSGDRVTITVSDDGRGINVERIRKKIVENGIIDSVSASRLTEKELISYIWHPGLSTAESVTDISGRGVGMDIVKSRIEALNGTVDIRTQPGQGTTFIIRLPLTLAILPSLLVKVHEEVYAIALDHIREIVEVRPELVHQIRNRRVIEIREKIVPVISLDDIFLWGEQPYPLAKSVTTANDDQNTRVVILHSADEMIGLEVDQLLGLQEVVLKSLEKNLCAVEGLSGASILGDGRVSLILDVDCMIDHASRIRMDRKSSLA